MRVDDKLCARASTATCVVSKEQVARQPSTELAGEPSRGAAKPFVSRRRLGTATRRRHAGVRAQVERATRHKAVRVMRLSVRRPPAERHQRDETHSAAEQCAKLRGRRLLRSGRDAPSKRFASEGSGARRVQQTASWSSLVERRSSQYRVGRDGTRGLEDCVSACSKACHASHALCLRRHGFSGVGVFLGARLPPGCGDWRRSVSQQLVAAF